MGAVLCKILRSILHFCPSHASNTPSKPKNKKYRYNLPNVLQRGKLSLLEKLWLKTMTKLKTQKQQKIRKIVIWWI
jgi:hypothetical protein